MKRFIFVLVILFSLVFTVFPAAFAASDVPKLEAEAAIVVDMTTENVLYHSNESERLSPASTTKMLTGILAIEKLDMQQILTADDEVASTQGTSLKLKSGETIKASDALNAMLVGSCNDCAVLIAKAISGSTENFVALMNSKVLEMGLLNTHFANPHGISEDDHFSSAADLSRIALYCMKNPTFCQIVKQDVYVVPVSNMRDPQTVKSTNLLLNDTKEEDKIFVNNVLRVCKYDGIFGVKTGYTKTAGGCLVAAAKKGDTKILTVVLKSSSMGRFADSIALLDWGFANYRTKQYTKTGTILEETVEVKKGAVKTVGLKIADDIYYTIPQEASDSIISTKLILESEIVPAPVEEGQLLGHLDVYEGGFLIGSTEILAAETVEEGGFLSNFGIDDATALKIKKTILTVIYSLLGLFVLYVIAMRTKVYLKRKKRREEAQRIAEEKERQRQMWKEEYDNTRYRH